VEDRCRFDGATDDLAGGGVNVNGVGVEGEGELSRGHVAIACTHQRTLIAANMVSKHTHAHSSRSDFHQAKPKNNPAKAA
jgi:hypothetical protein